jgi:uncharacterized protein (DUF305 family)
VIKTPKYLLAVVAVAATLTVSACGTTGPDAGGSGGEAPKASVAFNDDDVMFAQMMIPHHEQAVDMSDAILAEDGVDPRVVELATEITAAQEPEITQLEGWLEKWGADDGMSDMGHGTGGMMSDEDMAKLTGGSGAEATRLVLVGMTAHHEGAVEMAEAELDGGKHTGARAMATDIMTSQTAEIAVMADLLATM